MEYEFDNEMVNQGDLVDFGSYGKLYVCSTGGSDFWVTDREQDRNNPNARGWSIRKGRAKGIVENYR